MANTETTLTIETRDKVGTTASNAVRHAGKIPAVIYGHGDTAENVTVNEHAFTDLLHHAGRNGIVRLSGGAQHSQTALVRSVAYHPTSRRVLHVDFLRVSANESIAAELPIVTVGVARGIREAGGVMDVVTHQLEIEGPANAIPDQIEVDVSALSIHEHITAADVKLPDGFSMVTPSDTIVVSIEPSRTERDLEQAAAGPAAAAEPEVIGTASDAKPE